MPLRLNGSTSGYSQIDAPAVAGDQTFTLPGTGGTLDRLNRAGNVIQVVEANYSTSASTSTTIPLDTTIPQNTEGAEILSAAITPTSSSNKLFIQVSLPHLSGSGNHITAALFQDSIADALSVGTTYSGGSNWSINIYFSHFMQAGTTSSTTFKVRYGPSAGTAYINRLTTATGTFGGTTFARLVITEIAA